MLNHTLDTIIARYCDRCAAKLALVAILVHRDGIDVGRFDGRMRHNGRFHFKGGDVVPFGTICVAETVVEGDIAILILRSVSRVIKK